MQLASDWKQILRSAWSVRLLALAALLSVAEVVIPVYYGCSPSPWLAVGSLLVTLSALFARILAQKELNG